MRNTTHLLVVSVLATSSFFFYSCEKSSSIPQRDGVHGQRNGDINACTGSNGGSTTTTSSDGNTFTLTAGTWQTIHAGTVVVENDADNIYVTYTTTYGWKLNEVHVKAEVYTGVISQQSTSSISPELFPYSQTFSADGLPSTYTVTIPLSTLGSSTSFSVYAYAKISRSVSGYTQTETGWGGTIYRTRTRTFGSIVYNLQSEEVGK